MALTCEFCSVGFEAKSLTARFCSAKCRKGAFMARRNTVGTVLEHPGTGSEAPKTTVSAVQAELVAAGRAETYLGRAAVALATRIDESTAVMGFAALVKQLQATMDAALDGVKSAADPVDELRARRDRLYSAG